MVVSEWGTIKVSRKQAKRQTNRQTDRRTDRQTDRQTDKVNPPVINTEYTRYAPNSVLSAIAPLTIVAAVAANTK